MRRQDIITALSQGQSIPELKPLYETLQVFFEDMGIEARTMQDVHRLFKRIVIDNAHFPDEDVFDFFAGFTKREYTKGQYANVEQVIEAVNAHRAVLRISEYFDRKQLNPFIEHWSDQEIQCQAAIMDKLGISAGKQDGYFARLQAQVQKRNLSVPDIDLGPPGPLAKYL